MDALDNLIYATRNFSLYPGGAVTNAIISDFLPAGGTTVLNESENVALLPPNPVPVPLVNLYPTVTTPDGISSYTRASRENFTIFDDYRVIEDAITKHWYDMVNQLSYTSQMAMVPFVGYVNAGQANVPGLANRIFADFTVPPYHLIFSYLVENTRIAQIFEKLIAMYQHDEKLFKANQPAAFRWIQNTETLFYRSSSANRGITSFLRSNPEGVRRNAYQRMFGMDLAFGDVNNKEFPYVKADFANSAFITMFESFLVEIWQAYTNANNTSGQNSTDVLHIEEIVRKLQEMLMLRRTANLNFTGYQYFNLTKEEYASYINMFWLLDVISYNSPIIQWLNCDANTPGERLINIGKKVNLPAHSKSVALIDIAHPMNALLRLIELGTLNSANQLERIIRSRSTVNPNVNPPSTANEIAVLNNLLLILNNWEKATGHKIKNPEVNIGGTVRLQAPTARVPQVGAPRQPAMN